MTTVEQTNEQVVSLKFADVRVMLDEVAEKNALMVFDYEDPKGNKEARSQIHKLRSLNAKIDKAHKVIKADVLKQTKLIDGVKRDLKDRVAEMIDIHAKPIKEIEDRERERLHSIQQAIDRITSEGEGSITAKSTREEAESALAGLIQLSMVSDAEKKSVFQERSEEARETLSQQIKHVEDCIKQIDNAAELERLRKVEEEAKRKEREQQIKDEAYAKAKREAEEASERRIREVAAEAERAKEAIAKAQRDADELKQQQRHDEAKRQAAVKAAQEEAAQAKALQAEAELATEKAKAMLQAEGRTKRVEPDSPVAVDQEAMQRLDDNVPEKTAGQCVEIVHQLFKLCADGGGIEFGHDCDLYSMTVRKDGKHSHVGWDRCPAEDAVKSLHKLLCE